MRYWGSKRVALRLQSAGVGRNGADCRTDSNGAAGSKDAAGCDDTAVAAAATTTTTAGSGRTRSNHASALSDGSGAAGNSC
ncbi:MAG: hypothetical protein ACK4ZJ_16405, partial [Allorhizobium sp.]